MIELGKIYLCKNNYKWRVVAIYYSGISVVQPVGDEFREPLLPTPYSMKDNIYVDHSVGISLLGPHQLRPLYKTYPNTSLFRKIYPNHRIVGNSIEVDQ